MMQLNKEYTKQKRLLWVLLVAIITCILVWQLTFSKTIDAYKQVKVLNKNLRSRSLYILEKDSLQNELTALNDILGMRKFKLPNEEIFEEMDHICNEFENIKITSFPDNHQIVFNDYLITTRFFGFEGEFKDLLKLVYRLEKDNNMGRLVSVNFKKYTDYKRKKEILSLTILLQNYEFIHPKAY